MTTKLIGIKEFRQNISSLQKRALKNNWRFIILNRNQPVLKVEPLNQKDATIEKLALEIQEARQEVKRGQVYDLEKVAQEIGL